MLGINARVEDLREQLITDINRAQMPACLLDYVLTEILNDVRMQRVNEIQKERKQYKEEMPPAPGEAPVAKKGDGQGGIVESGRVRMDKDGTVKEEGEDDNNNPDS